MFDILHVANGHGTTRLIERAHLPGPTSIWADPLHEGPIVNADDDELIRIRAAAIARDLGASAAAVEADLKSWRRVVDADDRYDELVLWYEHDVRKRRPVTREQCAVAARAWDAFRSQARQRLETLLREDTSPHPVASPGLHPNAHTLRVRDAGLPQGTLSFHS